MFTLLKQLDHLFWSYIAFSLIVGLGGILTIRLRFFQFRKFPAIVKLFCHFMRTRCDGTRGVHPLRAFFASVGGMIGIGNVVGIVTAVQIGGPGALFWVWIAAMIGSVIKYSEIVLGLKHRVPNARGGYDGGPIYFLQRAFRSKWVPSLAGVLLCIYGVEIYQFSVITESLSTNWNLNHYLVMAVFLILVLYAGAGGVKRIGKVASTLMPFFLLGYVSLSLWVILQEAGQLPSLLVTVFKSAFCGHAAVGGFVGSSALLAIQHGMARAAYSADIGIGYDSIIQSESQTVFPEKQASLAIFGIFLDNMICTLSLLVVLTTGVWHSSIEASELVKTALGLHFSAMHVFMPLFLLIVGYMTITAYFCVGLKCARFLSPGKGERIYYGYAISAFLFFSFFDQTKALLIMSLAGAMLLCLNLSGIFLLRRELSPAKSLQPEGQTNVASEQQALLKG